MPDAVNHPIHYNSHPSSVECIEIIEYMNFCRGSAIKYIWRAGEKNPEKEIEDLKKAIWYLQREVSRLEKPKWGETSARGETGARGTGPCDPGVRVTEKQDWGLNSESGSVRHG